jgi:hypothetical protein
MRVARRAGDLGWSALVAEVGEDGEDAAVVVVGGL